MWLLLTIAVLALVTTGWALHRRHLRLGRRYRIDPSNTMDRMPPRGFFGPGRNG